MARVRLCVCGSWFVGREGQAAHPRAPGQCLHFECRGAPARVRAWRCEGRPPLPHHFVCVEKSTLPYLTSWAHAPHISPEHKLLVCDETRFSQSQRAASHSPQQPEASPQRCQQAQRERQAADGTGLMDISSHNLRFAELDILCTTFSTALLDTN